MIIKIIRIFNDYSMITKVFGYPAPTQASLLAVTSSCDQLLALNDIQSITKGFQRIFNDHSMIV